MVHEHELLLEYVRRRARRACMVTGARSLVVVRTMATGAMTFFVVSMDVPPITTGTGAMVCIPVALAR